MGEIRGAFGGSGGSSHQPVEANDTLQSRQVVKLLLAISEGEVEGIENILVNGVDIASFSASWDWRAGTGTQSVLPGFIDSEAPIASFVPVNLTTGVDYFTIVPWDSQSCRITLALTLLKRVNSRNDTVGYSVNYEVYVRPDNLSGWAFATSITKTGKSSSPYAWDTTIRRPSGVTIASGWEIRLTRITEADDGKHFSPTQWAAATAIQEANLPYTNTALIAITLTDAQQFGGNIPKITVKLKGIKVKIPTNYDPVNFVYDESVPWDGSLTEALFYYTANPAWLIYNTLNNSNYGLGIIKSDIDIISLYNLSKYCDELVDNGKGGTERRYSLHNQFYTREDPTTFLMYLLTICNANFTTNEFGQVSLMYDRPNQAITKQVANSNVIDGEFTYSSSELESRYNSVNVTYNREEFNGETDTATEVENSLIPRYSLQSTDIVLVGCTSEAQALRKARWAIYTNSFSPNSVGFKLLFAGLTYHVGELVKVFDNENQGSNQSGVIQSYSQAGGNTTITLDRDVDLSADPYTISFMGEDGVTEETYNIFETDVTTNTVSFTGLTIPALNGVFILSGAVVPKTYKVVKITKEEDIYNILSIEHKEEKYTYIDDSVILASPSGDFLNLSELTTTPVTNITIIENFASNGVTQKSSLDISWGWDKGTSKYKADFVLSWKRDSQESNFIPLLTSPSYDIPNPVPGLYEVTVWSVNPFTGIKSTPTTQTYNFRSDAGTSSLQPPENVFVAGTSGVVFNTRDLHLSFTYDVANNDVSDSLLDYVIEVWDTAITTLKGEYSVKPNKNLGGSFSFPFTENVDRFGTPTREFSIRVFSRDVIGDLSLAAQVTVNNPAPAAVSFSIVSGSEAAYVNITSSSDLDIAGYEIHRDIATFTPSPATLIFDGVDTVVSLLGTALQQYFYRVGVYDSFGKAGITYSGEQSSTMLSAADVPIWVFEGLIFKPNDPSNNKVSWTLGSASLNGATAIVINAGNSANAWSSGIQYFYYDGSSNTIDVTTDLSLAVTGAMVLATYKGGTSLIVGNGDAFTDGGLILANTVGANQLVADSAIITNTAQLQNAIINTAHIANGQITNAKIADTIQSANYNASLKTGWLIDKLGNLVSYGSMELRAEGTGDIILSSGAGATVEWNRVGGLNIPSDNATEGAAFETTYSETETPLPITWNTSYASIVFTSGSITKTGGVDALWDTAAYSAETYGDCVAKAEAASLAYAAIGLSDTIPKVSSSFVSIAYAIYFHISGGIEVYELGALVGAYGTYVVGDQLSVTYENNNIYYKKNNAVFLTRTAVGAGRTFYLDSSFYNSGVYLEGIEFNEIISSVEQTESPVDLINYANATVVDAVNTTQAAITTTADSVTKDSGENDWDASAYSSEDYAYSRLQFTAADIDKGKVIGLSSGGSTVNTPMEFSFYCKNDGTVSILQSGSEISSHGAYTTTTAFEIKYTQGGAIAYLIDSVLVASGAISDGTLLGLDTEIKEISGSFNNISFSELTYPIDRAPNIVGQITPDNVTTFIANLAVKNAQIAELAVTTAKIGDLAVDTLKIGDNAVTIPIVSSVATVDLAASAWTSVVSAVIIVPVGQTLTVQVEATSSPAGAILWGDFTVGWSRIRSYRLVRNGSVVGLQYSNAHTQALILFSEPLSPGTYTYTLQALNVLTAGGYSNQVYGNAIKLLGVKK